VALLSCVRSWVNVASELAKATGGIAQEHINRIKAILLFKEKSLKVCITKVAIKIDRNKIPENII
jgi:hypothetical protein